MYPPIHEIFHHWLYEGPLSLGVFTRLNLYDFLKAIALEYLKNCSLDIPQNIINLFSFLDKENPTDNQATMQQNTSTAFML